MKTEKLTPNSLLKRILRTNQFLKMMFFVLIVLSTYSCASLNSTNYKSRIRAVNKVTDQSLLYKTAIADISYEVQIAAFNKITDQSFINKLALESNDLKIVVYAINKVTDQSVLYKVVLKDINLGIMTAGGLPFIKFSNNISTADIRHGVKLVAFNKITDQSFINKLAIESQDPKLRMEAVNKLTDQDILYKVALEDKDDFKVAAMNRLNPSHLAKLVNDFKELNLKLKAIDLLTDQVELMSIFQNNDNWDVRKATFNKLNNNSLDILIREAKDSAIILSAKIRLGHISWTEAFSGKNSSAGTLGHIIGAAAIVDTPQPTSENVVLACHNFIKLGDASRIPELIFLLNKFGNVSLAEDYMNCGESTLEDAGCKWGRAHGYNCVTGNGSNRVRWGSKK